MRSKVVVMIVKLELSNVIFMFMSSFSFKSYLNTIFGCTIMASLVNKGLKSFPIDIFSHMKIRSSTLL